MERFSPEQTNAPEQETLNEIAAVLWEVWKAGPSAADPLDDLPPEAEETLSRAAAFFSPLLKSLQEIEGRGGEVRRDHLRAYLASANTPILQEILAGDPGELAWQWRAFLWVMEWRKQQKI